MNASETPRLNSSAAMVGFGMSRSLSFRIFFSNLSICEVGSLNSASGTVPHSCTSFCKQPARLCLGVTGVPSHGTHYAAAAKDAADDDGCGTVLSQASCVNRQSRACNTLPEPPVQDISRTVSSLANTSSSSVGRRSTIGSCDVWMPQTKGMGAVT
eukprot:COSAG01_NODE_9940_length_2296_cov_1.510696_2_plen_156_part_00